ncbi:MAG: hypothetical protein WC402_03435 [Candidatus Pacearchaeota archaeon]|jgi:hypothetical protein
MKNKSKSINKVFILSILVVFLSSFFYIGTVNGAEDIFKPENLDSWIANPTPLNNYFSESNGLFVSSSDGSGSKTNLVNYWNGQFLNKSSKDKILIYNSLNEKNRAAFFGVLNANNQKGLLIAFNSEPDSSKKSKYFSDLWNSLKDKSGKIDISARMNLTILLKEESMKDIQEAFNNAILKNKFKSVDKNKNKEIVFEGFGNSKVELTPEGNIKLAGGRIINPENIISSTSKLKLNDDGKTLEYTLTLKDKVTLEIKDSGNGQLTDKGYVNENGKVEFEYPYGNGKETLLINAKTEDGKNRNVYTLTGEGRAENWNDRNALRFVRTDKDGKVLGTYFVRASSATGEISFSLGEGGDLKNEGQNNFDVLIPSDNYDPQNFQQSDTLKSTYTVGAGSLVQFKDAILDETNIPEYDNTANLVVIGIDSAYISSKYPVTVVSYDNRLANGIISLTDLSYYGSDGNEWIRYAGENAFTRRLQVEPDETVASSYSGNDRYASLGCEEAECSGPSDALSRFSFPSVDPTKQGTGQIPRAGPLQVPGSQSGPVALGSQFYSGGATVTPGQQSPISQGNQITPGSSCPSGGCDGSYSPRRRVLFPRLRAFFGRLFGLFRRR